MADGTATAIAVVNSVVLVVELLVFVGTVTVVVISVLILVDLVVVVGTVIDIVNVDSVEFVVELILVV